MTKKELRLVFMGTPEFAAGILEAILDDGYFVAAVITAPDKPAGRGQKIRFSAVKELALMRQLPVLQPTNLKDPDFIAELKSYNANLQVVVAFRMLPQVVWQMPELGTFNLHASLLPQYRGAAPINWAIINGERETGVTTFFIDDKIDTGAMIYSVKTMITDSDTAGTLHDRLLAIGKTAVCNTLESIALGTVTTQVQPENAELKTAYKLNRDNCRIDWQKSGEEIYNLIRGLSPHPTAYTTVTDGEKQWDVKVYEAKFEKNQHQVATGRIITDKNSIKIAVKDGFVDLLRLQFPGKKVLGAREILNGMQFSGSATVV